METPAQPARPEPAQRDAAIALVRTLSKAPLFREYQQAFEAATGLPLVLRSAGAFQTPLHGSRRLNSFCALMSGCNKSCSACLQMQQQIEDNAAAGTTTMECFAGLAESAVPVRVGETIIGYLQTGQVLLHRPSEKQFRKTVERLARIGASIDEAALRAAYEGTRQIRREQYDSVLRLLAIFAEQLGTLSNQIATQVTAGEPHMIAKARAYIAEHLDESLSLERVARVVNLSEFYFCKIFHHFTGITFTHYVARVRIENVKQRLLDPNVRISEAAYAAGFQSLSQFNRVFARTVGISPTDYRRKLHLQVPPSHAKGDCVHAA